MLPGKEVGKVLFLKQIENDARTWDLVSVFSSMINSSQLLESKHDSHSSSSSFLPVFSLQLLFQIYNGFLQHYTKQPKVLLLFFGSGINGSIPFLSLLGRASWVPPTVLWVGMLFVGHLGLSKGNELLGISKGWTWWFNVHLAITNWFWEGHGKLFLDNSVDMFA